jgi:hypothetical protein
MESDRLKYRMTGLKSLQNGEVELSIKTRIIRIIAFELIRTGPTTDREITSMSIKADKLLVQMASQLGIPILQILIGTYHITTGGRGTHGGPL